MTFKQKVFQQFLESVNSQVNGYLQTLADLAESAANETKSTAGDKHETALAMLQIEQRNIKGRLAEVSEKKKILEAVNPEVNADTVRKGSLVKTNLGWFYLVAALGKTVIEGINITAISPQSPLGEKLLTAKAGDELSVNNGTYVIESIF